MQPKATAILPRSCLVLIILLVPLFVSGPQLIHRFLRPLSRLGHPLVAYQRLVTPDAGIEQSYPPEAVGVITELKAHGVNEYSLSPEILKVVRMHIAVGAFPRQVVDNAPIRVFAPRSRAAVAACTVIYENQEAGVAVCPAHDISL